MQKTTELIRKTLDTVFGFYGSRIKFFNASVVFTIVYSLVAIVCIAPIFLLLQLLNVGTSSYAGSAGIFNELYTSRFIDYTLAFYYMSIALFGIYIIRKYHENGDEKILHFKDSFNDIKQAHWILHILLLAGILLFYTLTFSFKFYAHNADYYLPFFPRERWADMVFELFKDYLPAFISMIFLMLYYNNFIFSKAAIKKYKNAFFASFISSFLIQTFIQGALAYYDAYVQGFFIELPFLDAIYPTAIGFIIKLAFLAFVFPATAIIFCYPFKLVSSQPEASTD